MRGSENWPGEQAGYATEEKVCNQQTTMTTRGKATADFVALRTVSVVVKNGKRSLNVNALLDDASTKTYIIHDVAAKLGLEGEKETVKVNVLDGNVEMI